MSYSSDLLTIEVTQPLDGVHQLTLKGDLDLFSGELLAPALAGVRGLDGARVVIDLGQLRFVDSSGVWLLMSAAKSIGESGGLLVFAAPSESVQRVFEILHLAELAPVEATLEAALARVSASIGENGSVDGSRP